jgi:gamma-glutamyltranspeptidase/glutathione hydrolase
MTARWNAPAPEHGARIRRIGVALVTVLVAGCAGGGAGVPPTLPDGTGTPAEAWVERFPARWELSAAQPPASAPGGMVVSTDSLASAAGLEVLLAGGNAVDAAIAVQFALAVTHPQAGNIGGGGFMIVRLADDTRAALDFRERAPGRATRDMYLDEADQVTEESRIGHLAAGVPGSVKGMEEAHRRFGTLPWERLLAPAIRYARGIRMRPRLARALAGARERFSQFPATAAVFNPGGRTPQGGERLVQADLTRTLEAIAAGGADAFYRGWVADSLVAEMTRGGGLIGHEDLAAYEAVWREPIVFEYRGREIISMPPPSSGGVTLGELLHIVEGYDLESFGWHSADAVHVAVEAMRRAYADRNHYLGDPDFVEIPVALLLSHAYADSLRASIDLERASSSERLNRVLSESSETTHFSVVDETGNAVAVTTTLNGGFGSGVVVRGAGFLLNNEMDDFAAKPGTPNMYGLVQGEANAIQPGKRMLSSMTPTIVVAPDGRTELVTGTPGGGTIITTVFQMVTNYIDFGLPVQTSVNAPRFHHQNLPDVIFYEGGGLRPNVIAELVRRGHQMSERRGYSGVVESIYIAPGGTRFGAADPRGGSAALGH